MTTVSSSSTSPSSSAAPSVFTSAIGWTYLVLNALDVLLALLVILHILETGYRSRRTRRLSLQTRELFLNPSADVTVTIREVGAAVTVARRMPLAVCTGVAIGGVVRLVLASIHSESMTSTIRGLFWWTIWLTPIIVTVFAMHALIITVVQQSFDLDRHNLVLVFFCAALSIASWAPSKFWLIHGRTDSEIVKTWPGVSRRVALVSLAYFAVLSMSMIIAMIGVSYHCSRQDVRPSQTDMKLPRLSGSGFAAEKERRAFENRRNHQIRYLERLAARRVVSWSLTLLAQCVVFCSTVRCLGSPRNPEYRALRARIYRSQPGWSMFSRLLLLFVPTRSWYWCSVTDTVVLARKTPYAVILNPPLNHHI
ncbi:hypothetical protein SAICODRAFT_121756 [Saitoella complicata NRRL Y-17804]|uniref:uncharacterized protein n=1 Tax=Saitoella complicata (strain BCRC 22490 / CBS 7301 / JCM 7358 / NBRC 10748 / NRRL Y-17804) TaxID=698492 RepID=UPI000867915A|nr:uncharacterized protein SAICODRAFT_121756 [Saitoella complicata NRRL Y-17804]ODQ52902.1 hypothetical protein SAICODRAFT_121756 [Saitoella complicata NRRL Y-17804]